MRTLSNNAESFTPTKDVTETTPDGRTIQIAAAGVPMPMSEARKLGLVKDETKTAATDEKAETPGKSNKSKLPSDNK